MKNILTAFLLLLLVDYAFGQSKVASGIVISDDDKLPIIGATVTVVGETAIGTVTDIDGKFQLNVPEKRNLLLVSYIGMKSTEVAVGSAIRVVLMSDDKQLGEIVVTGMQRVDKRLFTGAATKLDAENVKLDGVADVSRALEGRSAGVSVQNVSGTFGSAPKIRVRGATFSESHFLIYYSYFFDKNTFKSKASLNCLGTKKAL